MANPQRKGLKSGATRNELTLFAKIKPGHGEAMREEARRRGGGGRNPIVYGSDWWKTTAAIGSLHEARNVLFDNDTRFGFFTSFDGDWDTYIEDFATGPTKELFDVGFVHLEDWPGISSPGAKDWFHAHQVDALTYFSAYDASVKEIRKALELQKAFQQVLDHPDAAKVLAHPVLKPLLDRAAK